MIQTIRDETMDHFPDVCPWVSSEEGWPGIRALTWDLKDMGLIPYPDTSFLCDLAHVT